MAELHTKVDRSVKECSETVNKNVASAAAFLGAIQEKGKADLEEHARHHQEGARSALEDIRTQIQNLSSAAPDSLVKEFERLVENEKRLMAEAAARFEAQDVEEMQTRLRSTMEKLFEESAARLAQQAEDNILLVTGKVKELKEAVVSEASEALRAKLAEMFTQVLQPGIKNAKT